jgi:hypothetical protein
MHVKEAFAFFASQCNGQFWWSENWWNTFLPVHLEWLATWTIHGYCFKLCGKKVLL